MTARYSDASADGGFTLIEALVALAVLATVLASAFGVFSTGLRGISRSDERLTLALFAESLLARSGLDLARGPDAEASGSTAEGLTWRVTRSPYQLPKAEIDEAVEEAVPQSPEREERDAFSSSRFGQDEDASAGTEGEEGQQEQAEGTADSDSDTAAERRNDSSSGFGGGRSGGSESDEAAGAPQRPTLRLWQVQVAVRNARGESFTLSTLQLDRAPTGTAR